MIKEIITDCLLFSLWESIYFYLFARSYSNIRLKFYQIFVMIIVNSIIVIIFPPTIKQIIAIIFMSLYYFAFSDVNLSNCFKAVIVGYMVLFIIEVLYSIFLEYIFNIKSLVLDLNINKQFIIFLYLIPIRIIEYIIALKGKRSVK